MADIGMDDYIRGDDDDADIDDTDLLTGGAQDDTDENVTPERVIGPLSRELLGSAIDAYYIKLAETGMTPTVGRDYSKFELNRYGKLRLRAYPNVEIVNGRTGEPLSLNTIAGRPGGSKSSETSSDSRTGRRVKKVYPPGQ